MFYNEIFDLNESHSRRAVFQIKFLIKFWKKNLFGLPLSNNVPSLVISSNHGVPGQFRQPSRTNQLPPLISRVLGSFLNSRASENPRSLQACFFCVKLKAQIGVQTLEGIDRVFGSTEIGLEILDSCCPFLYTNNHQIYHFLVCNRFDPFVLLLEVRHLDLRFGRQPILRNLSRRYPTVEFRLIIDKGCSL